MEKVMSCEDEIKKPVERESADVYRAIRQFERWMMTHRGSHHVGKSEAFGVKIADIIFRPDIGKIEIRRVEKKPEPKLLESP